MNRNPVHEEKSEFDERIESLRKEMINSGIKEGITNEKTILLSQKLDTYITRYQASKNQS